MTVLTLGLKAKNSKFINYGLVGTAHAQCVDCCEQKPFYCPTSVLRGSERETLGHKDTRHKKVLTRDLETFTFVVKSFHG